MDGEGILATFPNVDSARIMEPREITIRAIEIYRRLFDGQRPVERLEDWSTTSPRAGRTGAASMAIRRAQTLWSDICQRAVRYVRNFVFRELNTLAACPEMDHDPRRPSVNQWYASSEDGDCASFVEAIREEEQGRLENEGGAAILYTHFRKGFIENGRLDARFREPMSRLDKKGGWFVSVRTILHTIREQRGEHTLTPNAPAWRAKWFLSKFGYRTS